MASIERVKGGYRVRWRQGSRNRAHFTGPRKADAKLFKDELERHQRLGTLVQMDMGTDTFEDFVADSYWPNHALSLSTKHQENRASNLDKYIIPHFGNYRLSEITRAEIEAFLAGLRNRKVGSRAQQTTFQSLKEILNKAVAWERLAANPAAHVKAPKHTKKPITPPTPLEVERVRAELQRAGRSGDGVLVSVLAYAGLRPQEALALTWDDIRDRTLLVGPEHKTGHRSVDLWSPLAKDLAEWKLATGGKPHLLFPNAHGHQWTTEGYKSWVSRVWRKKDEDGNYVFTHEGMGPPYHLRHLHSSLMLREDRLSLFEQANQAGHSIALHTQTYGHLIRELQGKGSAEDAIREARAEVERRAA